MQSEIDLLTARELAKRLRVSPETIRDWGRRGFIPSMRLSRKAIRYNLEAVLAALATPAPKVVSHGE